MKKTLLIAFCLILILSSCKPAEVSPAESSPAAATSEPSVIDISLKVDPAGSEPANESPASDEAIDSKPDYSAFNGDYNDAYSQRAYATLAENPDWNSVNIKVWWADSAQSFYMWEMNATYDGENLNYSDCKEVLCTTDEAGNDTEELQHENGSGYFVWDDGILRWTGAEDSDCRYCVFARGDQPYTEYGHTVLVSGKEKSNGVDIPAEEKEWSSLGDMELTLDTEEKAFRMWDWEPTEDDVMQNVVLALGKQVGDTFSLNFEYGDCSVDYCYTVLEVR